MRPRATASSSVFALFVLLVALVQLACRNPAEWRWAVQRGTIVDNPQFSPTVILPTQVVADQAAPVTVYTFGNGCVKPAYTNSRVSGAVAVVEPFDSVVVEMPPNSGCTDQRNGFPHSVSVVFPVSGSGTIRIIGWSDATRAVDTLEYSVTVQ